MKKIIVAIAALALMAGSAYAADWNFYGSARVSTFWEDVDAGSGPDPDTNFEEALQSNARIGAKVKVSDELTGRFEYGASGGDANIRLLYGEWDFGSGKLLVGQDYTPLYLPGPSQVYDNDLGLDGVGNVNGNLRLAQIKLTFGGFQIAFVENNKEYLSAGYVETDSDTDVIIPLISAKYALTYENWVFALAGGYQTFDVDNGTVDDDVTSWGLALDIAATFGGFKATGQVSGGTNVGNLWDVDVSEQISNSGYADVTGTKVIDNDAMGFRLSLGYTFNEMFGVEVGYGYQNTEFDVSGSEEDEVQSYYIQFPITLAPGVHIIPEVGVIDYEDDMNGDGEDEITYFGAKWQINF